jgi:hypothetical protein
MAVRDACLLHFVIPVPAGEGGILKEKNRGFFFCEEEEEDEMNMNSVDEMNMN